MFAYKELSYKTQHPRIPEAVTVLLLALRVSTFPNLNYKLYLLMVFDYYIRL